MGFLKFEFSRSNSRGSSSVLHLALNPRCETEPSVLSVTSISLVSLVSGGGSSEPQKRYCCPACAAYLLPIVLKTWQGVKGK